MSISLLQVYNKALYVKHIMNTTNKDRHIYTPHPHPWFPAKVNRGHNSKMEKKCLKSNLGQTFMVPDLLYKFQIIRNYKKN